MKIAPYVEKLEKSSEYQQFLGQNPKSFMVAGFFVLDLQNGKNVHQIDFYVPKQKKIAAFTLDEKVNVQLLNTMSNKIPEKLDLKTNIDLDALPGILRDEMRNRNMTEDIVKMIAVIQTVNGKKIWNVNCVLTGMEILKSHIEDDSETVLKIEKVSMMDLIKKISPEEMAQMQKNTKPEDEITQLDKLEEQIEAKKEELKKKIEKKK